MDLTVERKYRKETYTIGRLYVDGKYFCDTLEDKDRNLYASMGAAYISQRKQKGVTAIPYGTYDVSLTMSPRFGRVLPLIEDVPSFSGVRIHSGNTAQDTSGCLIVGQNRKKGMVLDSRATFNRLFALLEQAKGNIKITFRKG